MENVKLVAIDLAKNIYQVCGGNGREKIYFNKRLSRKKLDELICQLPLDCMVVMEAGKMAHYWGRKLMLKGYTVKLIAPQFVKPFVKGNKNDNNDVVAIYEAALRPHMRFVSVKTSSQQDIQSIIRARQLSQKHLRALGNQIRAFLAEYGITLPTGVRHIRLDVMSILEDAENGLTDTIRNVIHDLYQQYCTQQEIMEAYDTKIKKLAAYNEDCVRLMKLPGVGSLIATTLISAVGDARHFRNGREMSAWLGLIPKHRASGNRQIIQGISKRGDNYLRTLMIHGARSVLKHADHKTDQRSRWISDKKQQLGGPKTAVALANKMTREIWALLRKKDQFVFQKI